jgi:hypothetical protein
MPVQLSSLRVTTDLDASGYQRGAQQKVATRRWRLPAATSTIHRPPLTNHLSVHSRRHDQALAY